MERLTYKQAESKIFDAYFRDEIRPLSPEFCFCGTLCNNSDKLYNFSLGLHFDFGDYAGRDFNNMEDALLYHIDHFNEVSLRTYEDHLFDGMCAALSVLKQIHLDRGEIIDEPLPLRKRELVKA